MMTKTEKKAVDLVLANLFQAIDIAQKGVPENIASSDARWYRLGLAHLRSVLAKAPDREMFLSPIDPRQAKRCPACEGVGQTLGRDAEWKPCDSCAETGEAN